MSSGGWNPIAFLTLMNLGYVKFLPVALWVEVLEKDACTLVREHFGNLGEASQFAHKMDGCHQEGNVECQGYPVSSDL